MRELRSILIMDFDLLNVLKEFKDYLRFKCGIMIIKMASEILLHISYQKEFIPLLVSKVNYF